MSQIQNESGLPALDPAVWARVRDRIEEIESKLGLLTAELERDHSSLTIERMRNLEAKFQEVMRELDRYDDENETVRMAKSEFDVLVRRNHLMRDRHDS